MARKGGGWLWGVAPGAQLGAFQGATGSGGITIRNDGSNTRRHHYLGDLYRNHPARPAGLSSQFKRNSVLKGLLRRRKP